ncbi:MAG: dTMP kinase [Alphaproteobacteria bacterium]
MARGKFISFEGGEGSGKSTQLRRFVARLQSGGLAVVPTREPGGTPGGESIRKLLVEGEPGRWDAFTEALLHFAARRDHVERLVKPALAAGKWVISDRFADSTIAYQGYGHQLGAAAIKDLAKAAIGAFVPDLTVVIDIPVEIGLGRAKKRAAAAPGAEDRYERFDRAFHERVRAGFLEVAAGASNRCVVVDGQGSEDEVAARVLEAASARLGVPL